MTSLRTLGVLTLAVAPLCAHDVGSQITWSREVSRFTAKHCASCHRDGGSAFSLATYEQAKPKAGAMAKAVRERRMPPAGIVKGFGDLKDDESLTQEQIELITGWVESGALEGDKGLLAKEPPGAATAKAAETTGTEFPVEGSRKLDAPMTFAGISAKALKSESVKVTVQRPNGDVEPLVWFYRYDVKSPRTYWFRKAITLPAGSRIVVSDPSAIALIARSPAH